MFKNTLVLFDFDLLCTFCFFNTYVSLWRKKTVVHSGVIVCLIFWNFLILSVKTVHIILLQFCIIAPALFVDFVCIYFICEIISSLVTFWTILLQMSQRFNVLGLKTLPNATSRRLSIVRAQIKITLHPLPQGWGGGLNQPPSIEADVVFVKNSRYWLIT